MNKPVIGLAAAVAVAAIGYLGTQAYVGQQVSKQVEAINQQLVAHNEILVNRLEYSRGWGSGVLHYDLVYRPATGNPWYQVLDELLPQPELHWQGTADVDHGPWLPGNGFGLAQLQGSIPLPAMLRPWLPQYPGQAPMLSYRGETHLDNTLSFKLEAIDYKGLIQDPDKREEVQWEHSGAHFNVRLHPLNQQLTIMASLDALALDVPDETLRMGIENLQLKADSTRLQPFVWIGDASLALDNASFQADQNHLSLQGMRISSDTVQNGDKLNSTAELELGPIELDDMRLGESRLRYSMLDLDIEGYAGLMRAANRLGDIDDLDQHWPSLRPHLKRILAGHPQLRMDELSISLGEPYNTTASLGFEYHGDGELTADFAENIWNDLSAVGQASLTDSAIDTLMELFIAQQNAELGSSEQVLMADVLKMQLTLQLQDNPFARRTDNGYLFDFALRDRMLTAHEEPVMDLATLLAMGQALMPAPEPGLSSGGVVELSAGFSPDPYVIRATSGGDDLVDEGYGEGCIGYTTIAEANVELFYEAGSFPLIIEASAPTDTALVVIAPDGGVYCNDDRSLYELDPRVIFDTPETGFYYIWLTDLSGERSEADISITEIMP